MHPLDRGRSNGGGALARVERQVTRSLESRFVECRRLPSAKWPALDFPLRAENKRFRAKTLRVTNTTFPRANGLVYDIGGGRYILLHVLIIGEFTLQALSLGPQEFS